MLSLYPVDTHVRVPNTTCLWYSFIVSGKGGKQHTSTFVLLFLLSDWRNPLSLLLKDGPTYPEFSCPKLHTHNAPATKERERGMNDGPKERQERGLIKMECSGRGELINNAAFFYCQGRQKRREDHYTPTTTHTQHFIFALDSTKGGFLRLARAHPSSSFHRREKITTTAGFLSESTFNGLSA